LIAIVPELLAAGVQVLHLTGTLDWETIAAQRAAMADADGYHVFPYLHEEMALALAAADLAVCRAGASTLGELPLFGLPAVLVPYPHAWRYQKVNAEWLAQQGAGVVLEDAALKTDLLPLLRSLLDDPTRLAAMRERSAALAQPRGAANLADELLRLAGENV
jgi:UDP-N-acetylglucosamine:LPS N-acetylglucosamine transferase